jgi:hypothetical protein
MVLHCINIDNGAKIQKFIDILKENNITGTFENKEINPEYRVRATLLGALATLEWNEVFFKTENDIFSLIKEFMVQKKE